MPSNLVKTQRDEHLWDKAKQRAEEEGHAEDWAYVTGIFQKMKGKKASDPARARAKFIARGAAVAARHGGSIWIPLSALEADERGLILRAEPVKDQENRIVPYGSWVRSLGTHPYLYPDDDGITAQDRGIEIPEENVERAASRLRDPIDREARARVADASAGDGRFFMVPYRFARVRVGPPSPSAPPRDEFPFQGCVNFQGLVIDVENVAGSYREGKGWRTYMHYPYGEFRGSLGSDGDPLDVYVGPNALSPIATVIHQADPDTGKYDEDKVMVGFDDPAQAIAAYKRQYDRPGFYRDGWHRVMPVTALAVWMYNPEARGKPVRAHLRASSTVETGLPPATWWVTNGGPLAREAIGISLASRRASDELLEAIKKRAEIDKLPWASEEIEKEIREHLNNAVTTLASTNPPGALTPLLKKVRAFQTAADKR